MVAEYEDVMEDSFDVEEDEDATEDDDCCIDETDSAHESAAAASAPPPKKKRRKKKGTSFGRYKKGKHKGNYAPVTDENRKRKPAEEQRPARESKTNAAKLLVDDPVNFDMDEATPTEWRKLIVLYYTNVLRAPPPEEWDGRDGTVSQIVSALHLKSSQRKKVLKTITKAHHHMTVGEKYDGERAKRPGKTFIDKGSKEEQFVADYRERGLR